MLIQIDKSLKEIDLSVGTYSFYIRDEAVELFQDPTDSSGVILYPGITYHWYIANKFYAKSLSNIDNISNMNFLKVSSSLGGSGGTTDLSPVVNLIETFKNDYKSETDESQVTLDIIKTEIEKLTVNTSFGLKNITNPVNFNINTLATGMKYLSMYVRSGSVTITHNSNTGTLNESEVFETGNKFGIIDNNIIINGTCELLVSWEV